MLSTLRVDNGNQALQHQQYTVTPDLAEKLLKAVSHDAIATSISTKDPSLLSTALLVDLQTQVNKDTAISHSRITIKLKQKLTEDELRQLTIGFPEFNLDISMATDEQPHYVNRAVKTVGSFYMIFSCGVLTGIKIPNGAYHCLFKDCGAGAGVLFYFNNNIQGGHFCIPILSYSDVERKSATARYLNSLPDDTLSPNELELKHQILNGEGPQICRCKSENCNVKAPFCIWNHSVYDQSLSQLITTMDKSNAQFGTGVIIWDPIVMMQQSGTIKSIRCQFKKTVSNGEKFIEFHFEGDTQNGYKHLWSTYSALISTFLLKSHVTGNHYVVSHSRLVLSHLFFTLTRVDGQVPRSDVFRIIDIPDNKQKIIYTYELLNENSAHDPILKRKRLLVPTVLYEKIYQYALSMSEGKFVVKNIFIAACAFNNRVNVNGVAVSIKGDEKLSPDELVDLVIAVYLLTYEKNFRMMAVVNSLREDVNAARENTFLGKDHIIQSIYDIILDKYNILNFDPVKWYNFGTPMTRLYEKCLKLIDLLVTKRCYPVSVADPVRHVKFEEELAPTIHSLYIPEAPYKILSPFHLQPLPDDLSFEDDNASTSTTTGKPEVPPEILHEQPVRTFPDHCCSDEPLNIVNTPGDGDCLFHAFILSGATTEPPQIIRNRLAAVSFLNNKDKEALVNGIKDPANATNWGNDNHIAAFSSIYGVAICVHSNDRFEHYQPPFSSTDETFHILHQGVHWSALRPAPPAVTKVVELRNGQDKEFLRDTTSELYDAMIVDKPDPNEFQMTANQYRDFKKFLDVLTPLRSGGYCCRSALKALELYRADLYDLLHQWILDLCAGPGGMSQFFLQQTKASISAISHEIEFDSSLTHNKRFKAVYSSQSSADILDDENREDLMTKLTKPYSLIMADGCIDSEHNYNFDRVTENMPLKRAELEFVKLMTKDGIFIQKLFNPAHNETKEYLLQLINSFHSLKAAFLTSSFVTSTEFFVVGVTYRPGCRALTMESPEFITFVNDLIKIMNERRLRGYKALQVVHKKSKGKQKIQYEVYPPFRDDKIVEYFKELCAPGLKVGGFTTRFFKTISSILLPPPLEPDGTEVQSSFKHKNTYFLNSTDILSPIRPYPFKWDQLEFRDMEQFAYYCVLRDAKMNSLAETLYRAAGPDQMRRIFKTAPLDDRDKSIVSTLKLIIVYRYENDKEFRDAYDDSSFYAFNSDDDILGTGKILSPVEDSTADNLLDYVGRNLYGVALTNFKTDMNSKDDDDVVQPKTESSYYSLDSISSSSSASTTSTDSDQPMKLGFSPTIYTPPTEQFVKTLAPVRSTLKLLKYSVPFLLSSVAAYFLLKSYKRNYFSYKSIIGRLPGIYFSRRSIGITDPSFLKDCDRGLVRYTPVNKLIGDWLLKKLLKVDPIKVLTNLLSVPTPVTIYNTIAGSITAVKEFFIGVPNAFHQHYYFSPMTLINTVLPLKSHYISKAIAYPIVLTSYSFSTFYFIRNFNNALEYSHELKNLQPKRIKDPFPTKVYKAVAKLLGPSENESIALEQKPNNVTPSSLHNLPAYTDPNLDIGKAAFDEFKRYLLTVHENQVENHQRILEKILPTPEGKKALALEQGGYILLNKDNKPVTKTSTPINHARKFYNGEFVQMTVPTPTSLVSDYTQFGFDKDIYDAISKLDVETFKSIKAYLIQAAPGCGKTTEVIALLKQNPKAKVLCGTTQGRDDVRRRYGNPEDCKQRVRTMASVLMNGDFDAEDLLIDEALMSHPGAIVAVAILAKAKTVYLYGDRLQIPFVNRLGTTFDMQFNELIRLAEQKGIRNTTHRCPVDVTTLMSPEYEPYMEGKILYSTSKVLRSLNLQKISTIKDVPKTGYDMYLTFTQSDKQALVDAGYGDVKLLEDKVQTVHEFQGSEAPRVCIVRLSRIATDEIYLRKPYVIVALSRHREQLLYCTPITEDLLSVFIKRGLELSSSDLGKHLVEIQPKSGGFLKPSDQQFLPSTYRFLPQGQVPDRTIKFASEPAGDDIVVPESSLINLSSMKKKINELLTSEYSGEKTYVVNLDGLEQYPHRLLEINQILYQRFRDTDIKYYFSSSKKLDVKSSVVDDVLLVNGFIDHQNEVEEQEVDEIWYDLNDYEKPKVVLPYFDDFNAMQHILTERFDDAFISNKLDVLMVNQDDIELNLKDAHLDPFKKPFQFPYFDRMRPTLEAPGPLLRPVTTIEAVLAAVKRNFNVPQLTGYVSVSKEAKNMVDAYFKTYLKEDHEVFEPIEICTNSIMEWLSKLKPGAEKNLDFEFAVSEEPLNSYSYIIKRQPKPGLDTDATQLYPALQTIIHHKKEINAIFCSIFSEVKKRVTRNLKVNTKIFTDIAIADFTKILNRDFTVEQLMKCQTLEVDQKKYDKSQNALALDYECELMLRLGVPKFFVDLWFNAHLLTLVRDPVTGLFFVILYQRKTGDASTFIMNTFFCMGVFAHYFIILKITFLLAIFAGDDSLFFFKVDIIKIFDTESFAFTYNLEVKLYSFKYAHFCSKFLILTEEKICLLPDPLKVLTKMTRDDMVNAEHIELYRISCCDTLALLDDYDVIDILIDAMEERYNLDPSIIISVFSLLHVVHDKELFNQLYYSHEFDKIDKERYLDLNINYD